MTTPTPVGEDIAAIAQANGTDAATLQQYIAQNGGTAAGTTKNVTLVPAYRIGTATAPNAPLGEDVSGSGMSEHTGVGVTTPNRAAPTLRDADDVKLDFNRMSDADLEALGEKLVQANLLPDDWALTGGRADLQAQWNTLVDRAGDYNAANGFGTQPDATTGTLLTPEDMIDLYSGRSAAGKNQQAQTSTSVSYGQTMTADGARRMLTSMMTGALGRAPTAKEADDFQAALNDAQANNPTTTTNVSSVDASGNRTSTSHTSGGFDAQDFAAGYTQDNLQQGAEYKHYQAATTYYNAMLQALQSPTGLVNVQ